jgi:hypothetical protein
VELRLLDPEHMTLTFIFRGGGGESRERIELKHASAPSS